MGRPPPRPRLRPLLSHRVASLASTTPSLRFNVGVVGTANAIVGGWGNLVRFLYIEE